MIAYFVYKRKKKTEQILSNRKYGCDAAKHDFVIEEH